MTMPRPQWRRCSSSSEASLASFRAGRPLPSGSAPGCAEVVAAPGDLLHGGQNALGKYLPHRLDVLLDGGRGTLANLALADIDAAHPRVRGEGHEGGGK